MDVIELLNQIEISFPVNGQVLFLDTPVSQKQLFSHPKTLNTRKSLLILFEYIVEKMETNIELI